MTSDPGEWDESGEDDVVSPGSTTELGSHARRGPITYRIAVVRGASVGETFNVDGSTGGPEYIGQSAGCSIRLADPAVSRRHASVDLVGSSLRLRDLGSTNGTFVKGLQITDATLRGGEEIVVGSTVLRVEARSDGQKADVSSATSFGNVIGGSVAMRRLYPVCERLARSTVPIVVEGETGTGKEALAEAIHAASARASKPFVVFDCTAVHPSLIESALFGHEKGAYTGAVSSAAGVFEEANGGTLLIDEIGDLDKPLQAKLLRAIQNGEVRRIGGAKWVKVDVRILAATRRDLDVEVQEGRFRDDLFFRLAVTRVTLPPLRDRREDIALLARHFWKTYARDHSEIAADIVDRFEAYPWPGNVRELANTVARIVALGELVEEHAGGLFMQGPTTTTQAVSGAPRPTDDYIDVIVAKNLALAEARDKITREFERRYVERLLHMHGGDVARAAAASGIGERYLRVIRARVRHHEAGR